MDTPAATSRGTLALRPLAHLLVYSQLRGIGGSFLFWSPSSGAQATLLLEAGTPVKLRSNFEAVFLGRVLLEGGAISQAEHDASLHELAGGGRLHGQVLLARRAINVAQLRDGLATQLSRNLDALFRLPADAVFEFFADADLLADYGAPDRIPVDPLPRVLAGLREAPPWTHVEPALEKLRLGRLRIARNAQIDRLSLRADERRLIELLRVRPLSLSELLHNAEGLGDNGAKLLCYFLAITKQLEVAPDAVALNDVDEEPSWVGTKTSAQAPPSSNALPPAAPSAPSRALVGRVHLKSLAFSPRAVQEHNSSSGVDRRVTPKPGELRAAQDPAAALDARRAEIAQRASRLDAQTHFEVLGLETSATVEEAKSAFIELARVWHPDRMPKELADQHELVARIFARLGEAHGHLSDERRREAYLKSLQNPVDSPDDQALVAAALDAAMSFQKAEVAFKRSDYASAAKYARSACKGDPGQADYLALLAWTESMAPDAQSLDATLDRVAMLDTAISLSATCERAWFYRGMLLKRAQREDAAYRDFKRVTELNPRNVDAARELRIFEMRKGKAPPAPESTSGKGEGLFGRFFKKR